MHPKTRIGRSAIEQAKEAMRALPEYQPEEVNKMQAVKMLMKEIRDAQSKGYSLEAIGRMLAEHGIPITAGALRAYVSGAKGRGKGKEKRVAQRSEDVSGSRDAVVKLASSAAPPVTPAPTADRNVAASPGGPAASPGGRPIVETARAAASKGTFVPREDTRDI